MTIYDQLMRKINIVIDQGIRGSALHSAQGALAVQCRIIPQMPGQDAELADQPPSQARNHLPTPLLPIKFPLTEDASLTLPRLPDPLFGA